MQKRSDQLSKTTLLTRTIIKISFLKAIDINTQVQLYIFLYLLHCSRLKDSVSVLKAFFYAQRDAT